MPIHPSYLSIALRLDHTQALIVGGGYAAANKLRLLLGRCPVIHVWACDVHEEIQAAHERGEISLLSGSVEEAALHEYIPQMGIVFAATNDRALNRLVAKLAQQYRVPVCAVDDPACSSFITPAIVDRGPVQVAISTAGTSPVLARRLREKFEVLLPAEMGRAASFMAERRAWLKAVVPDMGKRRHIWEAFLDGRGYEAALAGLWEEARAALEWLVAQAPQSGEVWLVGAGPGHPDFLTLAALRFMQNADVVLYDHLVSEEILDRVRRDAERVYVGKKCGDHMLPQVEIQHEMIRRARCGERVLRLKGGDPFIFGRGGEEMEALLASGVPVRVVPGVTAANGCGAAAGIPLTHRECAQSCVFVTGHMRADGTLGLDWPSLTRKGQTVVVYMGLSLLSRLCTDLQEHGLPADWPMAVVERGTYTDQRVVIGTLANMPAKIGAAEVQSPALIFVGEVVKHRGTVHSPTLSSFFSEERVA